MSIFITILLLLFLLLLSGFFSGAEIAFFSISKAKAESYKNSKVRVEQLIYRLKSDTDKLLITILIGNNIVNIASSSIATVLATQLFGSAGLGIAVGVMTFCVLLFGEIIPKSFATSRAEEVSKLFAYPLYYLMLLFVPVVIFFSSLIIFAKKFFRVDVVNSYTQEELESLAKLSLENGVIEKHEHEIIENVLDLKDIKVKDIYVSKKRMTFLRSNQLVSSYRSKLITSAYSRFPVLDSADRAVGILYIRDLLNFSEDDWKKLKVRQIAKKPLLVGPNIACDTLYRKFKSAHTHLALVVGRDKKVIGLVTFEDVLEELVGEIYDERDRSLIN